MSTFNKPVNKLIQLSPLALAMATALTMTQVQAAEYIVTNTEEEGDGSLLKALQDARDNSEDDIILFDASLSGLTVPLVDSSIYFSEGSGNLTIDGSGAPDMTIDAVVLNNWEVIGTNRIDLELKHLDIAVDNQEEETDRAFIYAYRSSVSFDNVRIQDKSQAGEERQTYIIYVEKSEVTLKNTVIEGTGDYDSRTTVIEGEASEVQISNTLLTKNFRLINVWSDAFENISLSIENSFITNNGVEYAPYSYGRGVKVEGIYADASLNIRNTTIADNHAWNDTVNVTTWGNDSSVALELVNSVITNNSTSSGGSSVSAFGDYGLNATISHSTVTNNTSGVQGEYNGYSAINLRADYTATAHISNNIITGNKAWAYDYKYGGWLKESNDFDIYGGEGIALTAKSNLIGEFRAGSFTGEDGNIISENAGLKTGLFVLEDAVPTLCLEEDSFARDSADKDITEALDLGEDQLGGNRLADGKPDMGATEYESCEQAKEIKEETEEEIKEEIKKKKKGGGGSLGAGLFALLALVGLRRSKSKVTQ